MIDFLLHDPVINRGVDRLITVGPVDAGARAYLRLKSPHPVSFVNTLPPPSGLARTLIFVSDRNRDAAATDIAFDQGVLNIVRERDLAARFSL